MDYLCSVRPTVLLFVLLSLGLRPSARAETGCLPFEVLEPEGNYILPGVMGAIPYRDSGSGELLLDAYVHSGAARPGVLVVHGGYWSRGNRRVFVQTLLETLTRSGLNWVSVDYRPGGQATLAEQIEDVSAALTFVRCHSDRLKLRPGSIFLLGEDTGAYLAGRVAAAARSAEVAGLVMVGSQFGPRVANLPAGLEEVFLELDREKDEAEIWESFQLEQYVTERMPRTLVIHGEDDQEVRSAEATGLCRKLESEGIPCELHLAAGATHRVENWTPEQWGYKAILTDWLGADTVSAVPFTRPDRGLIKDIAFGHYGVQGTESPLLMDAYIPKGKGPFPAVILVHGGGWEAGDKTTYITPVFEPLARNGFAWFSINYRLTPTHGHQAQLEDVRRAVRYVRHHADAFHIDSRRLALLGESAGGQLAAQVASRPCDGSPSAEDPVDRESCEVQALISFYGVYDFETLIEEGDRLSMLERIFGHTRLDSSARETLRAYSPIHHVEGLKVPALLIHGTGEMLWGQALRYSEKLAAAGRRFELHRLKGAPHGMENWEGREEWTGYKAHLVSWLDRILRRKAAE